MQIINAFINSLRIFNNLFNHKGILHHKRLITHNYTKIKCKLLIFSFGVPQRPLIKSKAELQTTIGAFLQNQSLLRIGYLL